MYIPIDCLVSVLATDDLGEAAETALVGSEGVVGLPVFLGSTSTRLGAVVRVAGEVIGVAGGMLLG